MGAVAVSPVGSRSSSVAVERLIAIIVIVAFMFLSGGGGLGDLGSLAGRTVGPAGQPSGELAQECQTRPTPTS